VLAGFAGPQHPTCPFFLRRYAMELYIMTVKSVMLGAKENPFWIYLAFSEQTLKVFWVKCRDLGQKFLVNYPA
jgi:hypothetical protein